MRSIYPDIVDCAWASSAPVLAKKDFVEYLEQVGEDFMKYGGEQCYEKITQIFSRYHELLQTNEGIKQLKQEQNICEETDMTQPLNQAYFFNSKIMLFMGAAQSGNLAEIKQLCNDINFEETVVKTDYQCVNYIFSGLQNILSHHIPWVYQICTEFGYFQTTDSNKQPFSNDLILRFYTELCSGFGPDFNEAKIDKAVADTNKFYGGLNPNVTKVVFLHGSVDPWHRLGITKSLSDDVPAFVIEGTSHCADLYRHEPSDPEELIKARDYAERMVKYWLGLGPRPALFKEYYIYKQT
ncbi:hypothetical protein O0L34_g5233 [Tuta absoluta]|nr:hypothetical protein O0L34_g5233 [Tuta absoluta]